MRVIKIKRHFNQLNRLIIIVLTVIGLDMDGYQTADIVFFISVVLWLWLPELNKVEVILWVKISRIIKGVFCFKSSGRRTSYLHKCKGN